MEEAGSQLMVLRQKIDQANQLKQQLLKKLHDRADSGVNALKIEIERLKQENARLNDALEQLPQQISNDEIQQMQEQITLLKAENDMLKGKVAYLEINSRTQTQLITSLQFQKQASKLLSVTEPSSLLASNNEEKKESDVKMLLSQNQEQKQLIKYLEWQLIQYQKSPYSQNQNESYQKQSNPSQHNEDTMRKSLLGNVAMDYEAEINHLNNMLEKSSRIIHEFVDTKTKGQAIEDQMTLTDLNPIQDKEIGDTPDPTNDQHSKAALMQQKLKESQDLIKVTNYENKTLQDNFNKLQVSYDMKVMECQDMEKSMTELEESVNKLKEEKEYLSKQLQALSQDKDMLVNKIAALQHSQGDIE